MDDVEKIFADFKNRVDEIAEHAQQVHAVTFKADLKNGTSFNFTYNSEKFAKEREPQGAFKPHSVFNGIFDIIATLSTIALLVILIRVMLNEQQVTLLPIFTYSFFIASFIISALFHFFSVEQRVHQIFNYLKESLKILSLTMVNLFWASAVDPSSLTFVRGLSLVIAALAFLFLSGRSSLSFQVSLALTALLPFAAFFVDLQLDTILRCLLFSLWSVTPLVFKNDSRMRTNTIFALIGVILLFLSYSALI